MWPLAAKTCPGHRQVPRWWLRLCKLNTCPDHTAVFLNFNGENLPTNGYVAISALGTDEVALVCRTNQPGCCSEGNITGGWFDPNGSMIEFDSSSAQGFYSSGGPQEIRLIRGTGIPAEGIYTCQVPDDSNTTQTLFVGLYNESGGQPALERMPHDMYSCTTCVSLPLCVCRHSDGRGCPDV